MKQYMMKWLCLCFMTVILLTSCGQAGQTASGAQTSETSTLTTGTSAVAVATTTATQPIQTESPYINAPRLNIVSNGKTSFKIVYAAKASDEIAVSSILLRKAINEATGANVAVTVDQSNPSSDGSMEILVGMTNRSDSSEFKNTLSDQAFGIKITEKGIVIAATHEDFIPLAVDYFMANYLESSDHTTVEKGAYSISTAAGVICRGKLADLTNIRPDTNYATVSELVGGIPYDGNFKIMQGGCVTEKYAYMAVINTADYDLKDAGCYIYKLDSKTWKTVRRSGVIMSAHSNDITYIPEKNQIYVVHCYVNAKQITVLDADTLEFVETIYTDSGIYALDYHAPSKTFIGGQGKSGTIFFRYAKDGKTLITAGKITPISTQMITQGICRDDRYAYHVMYSTQNVEPYNTILIYDIEKKTLAHRVRLSISDQEPENISIVDGVFYIGCNPRSGSVKLDIYKSVLYEFDFGDCTAVK